MYIEAVLRKCELFCSCSLWPREPQIRPRAWLNNFEEHERPVAAVLLDHFVFFGGVATDQLLSHSLRRIAAAVRQHRGPVGLDAYLRNVIFTPVLGEDPNPTDSGQLFCRKVRQLLGFSDDRFVPLARAHQLAIAGRPIVLLDDFIGSGDQMARTWERLSETGASFASIAQQQALDASYVALVGTARGCQRLSSDLPNLRLVVAHALDQTQSIRSIPSNPLMPDIDDIPGRVEALLERYHGGLSLPAYLSTVRQRKYGYSELGLLLAFDHSVPDATIPLLWANGPADWTPLARRA